MPLLVHPLRAPRQDGTFDVYGEIADSLREAGMTLQDRDVLVVSSKYLSVSQGRRIRIADIAESDEAVRLGAEYGLQPKIAEAVLRESDRTLGGTPGFVLVESDGIISPNAGIDKSSAGAGMIVLYPAESYMAAERIRRRAFLEHAANIGVIVSDSRLMPGRVGTTGVSIACAGIEPVADMRGRVDLDGRPLKVTRQATADSLATAANHVMGEGSQSVPMALVRGSCADITGRQINPREPLVPPARCLYMRSLGGRS